MATIQNTEATSEQKAAASSLHEQHLYCRTYGHNWIPLSAEESRSLFSKINWGTAIGLRCETCSMVRGDIVNQFGQIAYRTYRQPDGYSLPGTARPPKAALRLEYIKRHNLPSA